MTPQQYERLAELFHAAQEIAPNERNVFLDQVSKSDPELRQDLESLLANAAAVLTAEPPGDIAAGYLVHHQGLNAANTPSITPGTRFDHYEIRSLLGKGGMGEVYLAEDVRLHRKVALKILPLDLAANQDRMQRFEQEAQAAAALNHPNVAHIYEIGQSEDTHFISIEYIDGDTLRDKIYRDKASLEELLKYLAQVAEGLSKAHAAGVVHRDLKPDNIMITRDGYAKVLDFGLAKLIEPPQPLDVDQALSGAANTGIMTGHSLAGMVMGTIGYMSPEQAQGKTTEIDYRSDIFSFGCILFEVVTKQKPFADESLIKSLRKIINEPAPSINEIAPSAPSDLPHIVQRCLAKDPGDRYQTIRDVELELKEVRQRMARASAIDPASHSQRRISSRTARYMKTAAISVAVIVFGYGLYKFLNRSGSSTRPPPSNQKRLTATGKAFFGSVSSDGKRVAYVVADSGRQSIWIREIVTSRQVQIIPPEEATYTNLHFSHDGNYVYFNKREQDGPDSLYQMPTSGGAARKMIENFATHAAFSSDDKRLAFVRGGFFAVENSLVVANIDGSEEKVLVTHKEPFNFNPSGIVWTPDGKSITCVSGSDPTKLIQVPLDGGPEKPVPTPDWHSIIDVDWLPDSSGLVVAARQSLTSPVQIFHLSYPGGEARKITSDFNDYPFLSLSADGAALVVIKRESASHIWLAPGMNADNARQLTTGTSRQDGNPSARWTPDGRIVYDSTASGNIHTWIMNADGSDQRQLTDGPYDDQGAHVSPDGRYIVFTSDRSNKRHIYRMDIDGTNVKQLTNGDDEVAPFFSPDGEWVICSSNKFASWKVPVDGGELVPLTKDSWASDISPDGRLIAYVKQSKGRFFWDIVIMSFAGGPPLNTFDVISDFRPYARWTSDGHAIIYNLTHGGVLSGVTNLWTQSLHGGPAKQLTDFKSETFFSFDVSRDGKLICGRGTHSSDVVLITDFR